LLLPRLASLLSLLNRPRLQQHTLAVRHTWSLSLPRSLCLSLCLPPLPPPLLATNLHVYYSPCSPPICICTTHPARHQFAFALLAWSPPICICTTHLARLQSAFALLTLLASNLHLHYSPCSLQSAFALLTLLTPICICTTHLAPSNLHLHYSPCSLQSAFALLAWSPPICICTTRLVASNLHLHYSPGRHQFAFAYPPAPLTSARLPILCSPTHLAQRDKKQERHDRQKTREAHRQKTRGARGASEKQKHCNIFIPSYF
jgi:hypothetical protein